MNVRGAACGVRRTRTKAAFPDWHFTLRTSHVALISMPVDKSEQRIREMFGEISPRYDFLNHFLSGGTDYYWRWRTVRSAAPAGDRPILDVCTGTGDLAVAYWKCSRGLCRVVGSDFTHEMLTLARHKTAILRGIRRTESRRSSLSRPTRSGSLLPMVCFRLFRSPSGCGTSRTRSQGCGRWPACARRAAGSSCSNSRCRRIR